MTHKTNGDLTDLYYSVKLQNSFRDPTLKIEKEENVDSSEDFKVGDKVKVAVEHNDESMANYLK